jgi:hypothetical protein
VPLPLFDNYSENVLKLTLPRGIKCYYNVLVVKMENPMDVINPDDVIIGFISI